MKYKYLYEICKEHGVAHFAVASAAPFFELREKLEEKNQKYAGFVEQNIDLRINPELTLPGVKSIIVVLDRVILPLHKQTDYHIVIKGNLEKIASKLQHIESFNYKAYTDTGPLCERELALRAGIGFIGKNHCLIADGGSMYNIGYILTTLKWDIELENQNSKSKCGNCDICIRACPTGTLTTGDFTKCLSYISQKKGEIDTKTSQKMGNSIYGCTICQRVCPYNSGFLFDKGASYEELNEIHNNLSSMSNKEYKRAYGNTAVGFIGKANLLRNVQIALSNFKNKNEEGY